MAHLPSIFKRLTFWAPLLSLAVLVAGCGVEQSPVASSDDQTAVLRSVPPW